MLCLVDGRLYALFASSLPSSFADTIYRLSPSYLHPWSTGGLLVVIVSVPLSWIVTPSFSGWKIVVYPSSANLFTLINDCRKCGSTCASLAFLLSCRKGRDVLFVV